MAADELGGAAARGDGIAHAGTYTGFLSLMKYGGIACFIVAAIVILIIAR